MSSYDTVKHLPLSIEGYRLEPLEREVARGFTLKRTVVVLYGKGEEGRGEEVDYDARAQEAFQADEGKLPFPDGAIIARIAWRYVPSEENNKVFGRPQSFVAGEPTNVQFMVKDSKKYAATGGWGFSQFSAGKPDHIVVQTCFSCHVPVQSRDYVFTRYSP